MKRRQVVYGDGAKGDILAIVDFISRKDTINADKALERLERRIQSLELIPERGRIVPELHWHGISTVREVFEEPWRVLYRIGGDSVVVVAVYDRRRRLDDVLMERFLR
jgi:toxin ParE1/3/4